MSAANGTVGTQAPTAAARLPPAASLLALLQQWERLEFYILIAFAIFFGMSAIAIIYFRYHRREALRGNAKSAERILLPAYEPIFWSFSGIALFGLILTSLFHVYKWTDPFEPVIVSVSITVHTWNPRSSNLTNSILAPDIRGLSLLHHHDSCDVYDGEISVLRRRNQNCRHIVHCIVCIRHSYHRPSIHKSEV